MIHGQHVDVDINKHLLDQRRSKGGAPLGIPGNLIFFCWSIIKQFYSQKVPKKLEKCQSAGEGSEVMGN